MSSETDVVYAPTDLNLAPAKASAPAGSAGAAVQFRPAAATGQTLGPGIIMVKAQITTAGPGIHFLVGSSAVPAPTIAEPLMQEADGWIRFSVPAGATHIRAFGEGTTVGVLYALLVRPYPLP